MANLSSITLPDGTTYNLADSRVDNIFGGAYKVVCGHTTLSYSSSTALYAEITTGLSSVAYAVACPSHTTAYTNYPIANSNGPPTLYCRKNNSSNGQIRIYAVGTGFVSGHAFPVDWIAIGT